MSKGGPLAFDIKSVRKADVGLTTVAVFACSRCGATVDQKVDSGIPLNVDRLAQQTASLGWRTDGRRRGWNMCPICAVKTEKNDTDSKIKGFVVASSPVPIKPTVASVAAGATHAQRLQIRAALDEHFDDATGRYLGVMTDAKIAEKVSVPRALVETIREAAYGPIREDPAIAALRGELAGLGERIGTAEAALRSLRASEVEIRTKLDAFGKARG